ncbi:MAG: hypothetical protein IAE77_14095 [Prosthecobacter sp.]|jgi:hypothetical protein|uniref:hypothetical protein n=1 Tax=Prosthecobacter sp. TaxID=1965333 RepID=UPI0019F42E82|nr:hypothetical protein [Prosthecobacter sp.]MBE2284584.1 hypothetical protein [Prosthecobacter sp.]
MKSVRLAAQSERITPKSVRLLAYSVRDSALADGLRQGAVEQAKRLDGFLNEVVRFASEVVKVPATAALKPA